MYTVKEASDAIEAGRTLVFAGEDSLLAQLPKGNWIGGTIPYFMAEEGGVVDQKRIFGHDLTDVASESVAKVYGSDTIANVYSDMPDNGFGVIIVPGFTDIHTAFATDAPTYEDFATSPLIGWISGIHLDNLGKEAPKVWHGKEGQVADAAVVLHCALPAGQFAEIDIVNLFEQGEGDTLTFESTGFEASNVLVNGEKRPFVEYLKEKKADHRWPLVADYQGSMVNVSFQNVDEENDKVVFYAPVFAGLEYKIAKPVADYVVDFESALPADAVGSAYSCNCILNFLYGELEGKMARAKGPMTFGEVAYQLLNQTMVFLQVHKN